MERTYWIEYLLWDPYKIFCMLPWLQIPSQTQRYFHEKELGSSSHTWLYICTCTCRDVCVYVSTTTTTFLPISILILIFILIPTPRSIPSSFLMPIPALYLSPPTPITATPYSVPPTHTHACIYPHSSNSFPTYICTPAGQLLFILSGEGKESKLPTQHDHFVQSLKLLRQRRYLDIT